MPSSLLSIVLHGSAAAAVPLHGDVEHDYFGESVSDAGDVDGDGYADLIIGAPATDVGAGQVMVYLGGPSGPSIVPALVLVGDPLQAGPYGTEYGGTVSRAGDVNGDGFDDVVIAADGSGEVTVHHGSASGLSPTPSTTFGGWGFLGTRLADAGDVNGDGFDDLIVAAIGDAHYQVSGRAFVHLGSPAGIDPVPVVTWTGGEDFYSGTWDYRVGDNVAGAGDVNGDGYDDVLITVGLGEVHLHAGSPSGPSALPTQVWTDPTGSTTVADVAGTDVNGDGFDDVVFTSAANGGVVRVFSGSAVGVATTPSSSVRFEDLQTLSRAGDVNGDGFGDVVVGAPYADDERGRVAILVGSDDGLRRRPWSVVRGGTWDAGYDQGDRLGWSVSTALDLNGDGFDDVVVGGPVADAVIGQALVTTGHPDLTLTVAAASANDGVSVDVRHAAVGTPITVRVRLADDPGQTRVIGHGYPNSIGEVHVEGPLPAGVAAGTEIGLEAVGEAEASGWTVTERSEWVDAVVTP